MDSSRVNEINQALAKKKLLLLQEESLLENPNDEERGAKHADQNANTIERGFGDAQTSCMHENLQSQEAGARSDGPAIFGAGSINQTAKDQFAAALLRLQADLDKTSHRLGEVESRIESLMERQSSEARRAPAAPKSGAPSEQMLHTLTLLGWPVVVYVLLRALERRLGVAAKA